MCYEYTKIILKIKCKCKIRYFLVNKTCFNVISMLCFLIMTIIQLPNCNIYFTSSLVNSFPLNSSRFVSLPSPLISIFKNAFFTYNSYILYSCRKYYWWTKIETNFLCTFELFNSLILNFDMNLQQ